MTPRFDDPQPCAPILRDLGACADAVAWVGDRNFRAALAECHRADWMLWLCTQYVGTPTWPTRQQVTLAACACAETALRYVRPGEDQPRLAIETARRWARGDAAVSHSDVRVAAFAAHEARAAYAAGAAAFAAYAAAYAAYAAADAAAYVAADAAARAAYAAGDAGKLVLAHMADLLRLSETWR